MGPIFIYVAFACALTASGLYFTLHFKPGTRGKNLIKYARLFYHVSIVGTIGSAAFLLYLILTHQFQYTYVWDYSSRDLPLNLLISTFYAGQEGSFHLWAFLMAVLGIFLLAYTSHRDKDGKDRYEVQVMGIFALLQSFLLFILIIKSPYNLVWESFPKDVQAGFVPPDGRGLNPLLQNFWMSIHPPILFTGFSSLAIPFCFALAAMLRNQYDRWLKLALPWTLFSGMVLGTGIMLGGFWAYGVLGWGGYWGWDPVENSSFVPWIVIVAAIHTMISEQKTGKFKKTGLFLCIVAYILVLYSTFLTRSGVLGDASVHSFVDPGQTVFVFLIIFMFLFKSLGYNYLLKRFFNVSFGMMSVAILLNIAGLAYGVIQSINAVLFVFLLFGFDGLLLIIKGISTFKKAEGEGAIEILSRESALFIGSIALMATALVILMGTSWPIIAKGTVDPEFYNRMNLPLAILIASINGFSILLKWRHSEEKNFLKSLYLPFGFTVVATGTFVFFGMTDVLIAIFAAAAFFAFFINLELAYRVFAKNKAKVGPYIAHLGIMLLFLGIIGSSKYSKEVNISLPLDETKEALGYTLTYKGATPIPGETDKYHFNVVVEKDGRGFLLQPIMFYSDYSQGVMKNPDIANLITKDVYLSPMSLEVPADYIKDDEVSIKKDEVKEFKGLTVKFIDFDRSKFNRDAMQNGKDQTMGAELEVTIGKNKETVIAQQKIVEGNQESIPVKTNDGNYTFYLDKVSVTGESSIDLAIVDSRQPKSDNTPETLVLTASIKPFINLVWGGTIVMVLGFFFSLINRYRKLKVESIVLEKISTNGNVHTNGNATRKKMTNPKLKQNR
jgi:cytochrome c-type biogenesis protein CcmF